MATVTPLSERSRWAIFRTIALSWAAVGLPLLAVLAAALRPTAGQSWVTQLGEIRADAPIIQLQSGTDRQGGHAAAIDATATIHVLRPRDSGLAEDVLPPTWRPTDPSRVRVLFVDVNGDDLLDLVAMEVPPGARTLSSETAPTEWRCAIYLQSDGHFRLDQVTRRSPFVPPTRGAGRVQAAGVEYVPQLVPVPPGVLPSTRLLRADDGRATFRVAGVMHSTLDADGDGYDDLLTVTTDRAHAGRATYRLLLFRREAYLPVWQESFDQVDLQRVWQRLTQVVDLSGSGRSDIVVAEGRSGRVSVWRLPLERGPR